jgi:hypothetical protein
MSDFAQILTIRAPVAHVHQLITRQGHGWWTREATQSAEAAEFRIPRVGFLARFRVLEDGPERIVWRCEESTQPEAHGYHDRAEWNGTTVRFVLAPDGADATTVRFTHEGLVPSMECHDRCARVWSTVVLQSLRQLAETGTGDPV